MMEEVKIAQLILSGKHELQIEVKNLLYRSDEIFTRSRAVMKTISDIVKSNLLDDIHDEEFKKHCEFLKTLEKEIRATDLKINALNLTAKAIGYPKMFDIVVARFMFDKYGQLDCRDEI